MKASINQIQFTLNNKEVVCKNLIVWDYPDSYWEPGDRGVECENITIDGVEIDWENDELVEEIFDKAEYIAQEHLVNEMNFDYFHDEELA